MNRSFKVPDQLFFAQRLSLLLQSGISMVEALTMMRNIEASPVRKKAYAVLIQNIEQGVTLSRSIKNAKISFKTLLMTLIQNGESSGRLAEALQQAFLYLDKSNEMKKKFISSLLYPFFIVLATIVMTLFLVLYIFPKIIPLLSSLDIDLPLITRIVQGIYYFSISYGLWSMAGFILLIIIVHISISRSANLKRKAHLLVLSTPFLHSYIKTYLASSFCNMGEMLLSSGKGLPDLLLFSKDSARNVIFREVFGTLHDESVQGISLSTSLKKHGRCFPPLLADMSALGEKTGNLAVMFGHCSKIFEQDIENALKRFSSLVEPCLMVLMGLIVGSIALSIILPVYEITNQLSK